MASEDIIQLNDRDHVRTRPGMYIGSTENCDALLSEIVGNSMDELYSDKSNNAPCDTMWINFKDGTYTVADNCRGIPIKESPQKKGWTMARLAVSTLNAGSKFNKTRIAVGQNGVGSSAVNFLSSEFSIKARVVVQDISLMPKRLRDEIPNITEGLYYSCKFKDGNFSSEGFEEIDNSQFGGQYPSTITSFRPDLSIMKSPRAKLPSALPYLNFILKNRGREAHIYVNGKEYKDSIESYGMDIKSVVKSKEEDPKNPEVEFLITLGFNSKLEPPEITGSVNGLNCREGVHVRWARNSFKKAFSDLFSNCGDTALMGIRMCVVALCNEPAFSSQTKEKLSDIEGFNYSKSYEVDSLAKSFKSIMKSERYYNLFKNHELKILEYMKSTEKLGRKEFIKSTVLIASQSSRSDAMVPEKLIDCSSTNRHECELYIVEGDSAGGALVNCRDPRIHAILPLRGKVLNTTGLEIEKVLGNREMKDLISAIGVGVNDYHDMSEVRYGKVVIVADAD